MTWAESHLACAVDDTYDREMASDGQSRFGAYLRQRAGSFGDIQDDVLRVALTAWRIAQSPIMAPGYVRWHPRVVNTDEHWDDEGRAGLTVQMAAPLPPPVIQSIGYWRWQGWERYGWQQRWVEPYDNDRPAAFTTLAVRLPIDPDLLPTPTFRHGIPTLQTARHAIRCLCRIANETLTPILAALTQ